MIILFLWYLGSADNEPLKLVFVHDRDGPHAQKQLPRQIGQLWHVEQQCVVRQHVMSCETYNVMHLQRHSLGGRKEKEEERKKERKKKKKKNGRRKKERRRGRRGEREREKRER